MEKGNSWGQVERIINEGRLLLFEVNFIRYESGRRPVGFAFVYPENVVVENIAIDEVIGRVNPHFLAEV